MPPGHCFRVLRDCVSATGGCSLFWLFFSFIVEMEIFSDSTHKTKTDPYEYAYTSSTSSSSAVHRCPKNAGMSGATKERALHSWWALWLLSRNIPGTYMHNIASLVSAYEKIVCTPSCYTHSGREHYYILHYDMNIERTLFYGPWGKREVTWAEIRDTTIVVRLFSLSLVY